MSTRKRAAIAAAVSGIAGSAATIAASHYGQDLLQSAKFGAVVSGAVGNLLYQVFRLTPDGDTHRSTEATVDTGGRVTEPRGTEPDLPNVPGTDLDTVSAGGTENETDTGAPEATDAPCAGPAVQDAADSADEAGRPGRKRPKHRRREHGPGRRVERDQQDERKDNGRASS